MGKVEMRMVLLGLEMSKKVQKCLKFLIMCLKLLKKHQKKHSKNKPLILHTLLLFNNCWVHRKNHETKSKFSHMSGAIFMALRGILKVPSASYDTESSVTTWNWPCSYCTLCCVRFENGGLGTIAGTLWNLIVSQQSTKKGLGNARLGLWYQKNVPKFKCTTFGTPRCQWLIF